MRGTHRKDGGVRFSLILCSQFLWFICAPAAAKEGLRDLADKKGLLFGAAAGTPFFGKDSVVFKAALKKDFNALVAEYQMKFGQMQPTRGDYNWAAADRMLAYADANRMALRGHCLDPGNQLG